MLNTQNLLQQVSHKGHKEVSVTERQQKIQQAKKLLRFPATSTGDFFPQIMLNLADPKSQLLLPSLSRKISHLANYSWGRGKHP